MFINGYLIFFLIVYPLDGWVDRDTHSHTNAHISHIQHIAALHQPKLIIYLAVQYCVL